MIVIVRPQSLRVSQHRLLRRTIVRTHRLLGVALCLVLFPLAAAHAQNLITNPRFDRDLSGWTIQQGSVVWANQDAGGGRFSGSMEARPGWRTNPPAGRKRFR